MQIRAATKNDFEGWQKVRRGLWDFVTDEENRTHFAEHLTGEHLILVAETGGEIVGFVEASIRTDYVEGCETNRVGYIEGWFVEENFRRQNVGRELIAAAENWAHSLDCREMASDCDLENELSLRAHLGIGYEEAGRNIHFKKNL